jgi:hypothetical protein
MTHTKIHNRHIYLSPINIFVNCLDFEVYEVFLTTYQIISLKVIGLFATKFLFETMEFQKPCFDCFFYKNCLVPIFFIHNVYFF